MARHRKPKQTGDEVDDSQSKFAKLERYGCVNWSITELFEGKTFESLEIKRRTLCSRAQQSQRMNENDIYCTAS